VVIVFSLLLSDFYNVSRYLTVNELYQTSRDGIDLVVAGNISTSLQNDTVSERIRNVSDPDHVQYVHRTCQGYTQVEGQPLFGSSRLRYTDNPDLFNAWWTIECMGATNVVREANASIVRRIHQYYRNNDTSIDDVDSSTLQTILGDWKIFLVDYSDLPSLEWLEKYVENVAKVVGWNRTYFITRATTVRRRIDSPHTAAGVYKRMYEKKFLGGFVNFSQTWIGRIVAGVKRFHFPVRDDILSALEEEIVSYCNETRQCPTDNADWVHDLPRPKDVAHFWNANLTRKAKARAVISQELGVLRGSYPNISIFTDFVGTRGKEGRQGVHTEYARALLEYKIVVLAQRDRYEDHYRLFEALISGAMVMTDPALCFPWGVVHNETIVVYRSVYEMRDQVIYYLQHDEERRRIAQAGRDLSLNHHLLKNRWEDLLLNGWNDRDDNGVSILKP
jgi:hypothetical protein